VSLFRINRDDQENFTIVTTPKRTFSSGSGGVTGSVNLFVHNSPSEKETQPLSLFDDTRFADQNLNELLDRASIAGRGDSSNNNVEMQEYLSGVNAQSVSARKTQTLNVERFEPSFTLTSNSVSKRQMIDTLMPFYRNVHPQAHFAYTNYHCLNFFTASELPETSAVIYPNSSSGTLGTDPYSLTGPFTFDFWINPKYTTDESANDFKAGTIYHLSSSYAISLVTGSSIDSEGKPDGYRVLLQLSHSADLKPSEAVLGAFPSDLVFLSEDNSLKRNNWHHVVIRWGTQTVNRGTGSFNIDGEAAGTFVVPSASINHTADADVEALIIGNYYEGNNIGNEALSAFFALDPATRDGLSVLNGSTGIEQPFPLVMDHPLNAEVHDLKIYNKKFLDSQIVNEAPPVNQKGLVFYVPPFFTKESPFRKNVGTFGGVLQTPFFSIDSTTDDPFNVAMSFGVGGHYLNTENFARDMVTGNFPRWLHLTASQITGNAQEALSANAYLYATGSTRKRNVSILPCDNGLFVPNFQWLMSGTNTIEPQKPTSGTLLSKYVNDLGTLDLSFISLNDLVPTSSLRKSIIAESGSIFNKIVGATPDNPGVDPGEVLTIFQRTRDNSSNELVFFDMSNLYYGERIRPGSLVLTDSAITGTQGKVSMTIKDDGHGSLYRADSITKNATWNSIGNIFYNEGIMMVKTPNVPLFGEDQWDMSFEGEHCIHTLKLDIIAGAGMVDSSSNPSYLEVSASFDANDKDSKFVYITNILYLDDNLNVVMRSNLSQPIIKRRGDKITFRPKIDF
jgi:hypothetical protein